MFRQAWLCTGGKGSTILVSAVYRLMALNTFLQGSFSTAEMIALGQELVKKLGGVKGVTLAEVENLGPSVVTIFLPGEYKYLSNDVFEYM
jgi:hypothetical protein